jgi:hypothetical protein
LPSSPSSGSSEGTPNPNGVSLTGFLGSVVCESWVCVVRRMRAVRSCGLAECAPETGSRTGARGLRWCATTGRSGPIGTRASLLRCRELRLQPRHPSGRMERAHLLPETTAGDDW